MNKQERMVEIEELKESLGITPKHIEEARDWIKDCMGGWRDLESEDDVDDLTDNEILRGVQKHYNGGLAQFIKDSSV